MRAGAALVAMVVALILGIGLLSAPVSVASPSVADASGRVRGEIRQVGGGPAPTVKVLWFARDWTYLGARKARGGGYSLSLPAGKYYLQFVDEAPSYDVTKNRPTTVRVQVRTGRTTVKKIKMRRGASIGGVVRAGGKPGKFARVVAANTSEQSFETTADKRGRFALGGLPPGKYSVFTYDRKGARVAKSLYLGRVKGRGYRSVAINLNRRAGNLLVDLYAGSDRLPGRPFVTAISRKTGQFWTARARRGSVTFRGLYPGKYDLQMPATGDYFAARLRVRKGVVKSGRTAFGSARLTQRGARVEGSVVDGSDPAHRLPGATVRLLDAAGSEVDRTTSAGDGSFTLDGQIRTQRGMRVLAGPGPFSPYLDNCLYNTAERAGIEVTTGRRTAVGGISLPRSQSPGQPKQCLPAPD